MMSEESILIEQARTGSEEAFSRLLELHQAQVRGYLARYVRNPDVVDDLAQETFLDAYRTLGSYRGEAPLRLWLIGIARNRALRYLREEERRRSRRSAPVEAALAGWLVGEMESIPSERSDQEQELQALKKCVKGLPEKSASFIAGFYYEGRSALDLARQTGKTESAVWVTLTRIRQALRECVQMRLKASGSL